MNAYRLMNYRAVVEEPADAPVACDVCEWIGVFADMHEIDECSLTPGDPSPMGRCPTCGSLAYRLGSLG